MDWREELREKGYTVIPDIFTAKECRSYIGSIKKQLAMAVEPEDIPSFLAREASNGVVHGLDNLRVLWDIRTAPAIRDIFRELYPSEELYLYVDRFNYRPIGGSHSHFKQEWHLDEDPTRPQSNYQAFVSLTRSDKDDDCLGILEGSHRCMAEFIQQYPTHPFYREQYDWFIDRGCTARRVACPAGSLVIWDSRCYHTPLNSLRTRPFTRMVVYVRYFPTNRFPKEDRWTILKTYPEFLEKGLDIVTMDDWMKYDEFIMGSK